MVPPSLTITPTDHVTYVAAPGGSYVPGQSVTITATLAEGFAWSADLLPWTAVTPTTATQTLTFKDASCEVVTPAVPAVTAAACTGGVLVAPEITTGPTPGVVYTRIPTDLGDGTTSIDVTVTATVATGYAWPATLPAGWTHGDTPLIIRYTLTLAPESCTPVTPEAPGLTQGVCVGGVVSAPTLTLASTTGISYSVPPGPYTAGQTVTVTATLDPEDVSWPTQLPTGWTRRSPTTATNEVTFAHVTCTPATLANPAVTQATCAGGRVTAPSIVVPPVTGVSFTTEPTELGDGTRDVEVTVTATLEDGYGWGTINEPWKRVDVDTATFTVTLRGASCREVLPVAPTVTQARCAGGVLSPPTLVLAKTDGITYAADPAGPYVAGLSVIVTATLGPAGVGWPAALPAGWTRTSNTTATLVVPFADVPCTPVVPVAPTVTSATCAGGAVIGPSILLPTTTGVSYALEPEELGEGTSDVDVTVTATLADGFRWGTVTAPWTRVNDTTARWTVTLTAATCAEVTPVAPTVTQAMCAGGVLSPPTLALATTDKITYTVAPSGQYAPGGTATVTATLAGTGVAWPDALPPRWVRVNDTTATYAVTFKVVACTPVALAAPTVTQATCTSGAVSDPSIALPDTPGVVYVLAPPDLGDGTSDLAVTVTATLLDGFSWDQMPEGWKRVDAAVATFAVVLVGTSCAAVTPAAPAVKQAVCAGGVVSAPTLELAGTTGMTYAADPPGPYLAGQSVTVTATLDPTGVAWPATLPPGWERTSDTVATLIVKFAGVTCRLGTPAAPTVTQATCATGAVTVPTVVLASSPGITYLADPPGPYDGTEDTTVTVTATVHDGYGWEQMPTGWTEVTPATATFTVELVGASCDEVAPVAPALTQAVCAGGVVSEPTLTLAVTDGITYTADPGPPYTQGATVIVTATLDPAGVAWPGALPPGWAEVDDTTATYAVVFDRVSCKPVVPVAPSVTQPTCANGVVMAPTIRLPDQTGVVYTIDPADLGDGTADVAVTVTATVDDGFGWGTITLPWTRVDDTTATVPLLLVAASCDVATPVAPAVTEAVCTRGQVTVPMLTLAGTDGITYAADPPGPYAAGQSVTVTATLDPSGVAWPEQLPPAWTRASDTTATYAVTFENVSCHLGAPVAPTVIQATCVGGAVSLPEIVLPRSFGIAYSLDPAPPYDPTIDTQVTVTATTLDGYGWDPMPPGWTQLDSYEATFVVTLYGASCDEVNPVSPAVTQAICSAGAVTAPTLALPQTDGVTYAVDGAAPYRPGQTVNVTATLDTTGVGWPPTMPPGWTVTSDVTATSSVTFDDKDCKPVPLEAPAVGAASCVDGVLTLPAITLSETTGLVYVVEPAGSTVTASLVEGFTWDASGPVGFRGPIPAQTPPSEGWTQISPTKAAYAVIVAPAPDCAAIEAPAVPASPAPAAPIEPATPTAPGDLALTGTARVIAQLLLAVAAVAAGCLLLRIGRRRRPLHREH